MSPAGGDDARSKVAVARVDSLREPGSRLSRRFAFGVRRVARTFVDVSPSPRVSRRVRHLPVFRRHEQFLLFLFFATLVRVRESALDRRLDRPPPRHLARPPPLTKVDGAPDPSPRSRAGPPSTTGAAPVAFSTPWTPSASAAARPRAFDPTFTFPVAGSTRTSSPAAASSFAAVAVCGCNASISRLASSLPAHMFLVAQSAHSRRYSSPSSPRVAARITPTPPSFAVASATSGRPYIALASGAMRSTRYPSHGREEGYGGWPSRSSGGAVDVGSSLGAAVGPPAFDVCPAPSGGGIAAERLRRRRGRPIAVAAVTTSPEVCATDGEERDGANADAARATLRASLHLLRALTERETRPSAARRVVAAARDARSNTYANVPSESTNVGGEAPESTAVDPDDFDPEDPNLGSVSGAASTASVTSAKSVACATENAQSSRRAIEPHRSRPRLRRRDGGSRERDVSADAAVSRGAQPAAQRRGASAAKRHAVATTRGNRSPPRPAARRSPPPPPERTPHLRRRFKSKGRVGSNASSAAPSPAAPNAAWRGWTSATSGGCAACAAAPRTDARRAATRAEKRATLSRRPGHARLRQLRPAASAETTTVGATRRSRRSRHRRGERGRRGRRARRVERRLVWRRRRPRTRFVARARRKPAALAPATSPRDASAR